MRVLVMGGTQFNGLALVHELVRLGHADTVCTRGRTETHNPASVGRLVAHRPDHDQLRAVLGGTEWDCVHDVSAYHPEDVDIMMELFRDAVGHYVFASSTVTYASQDHPITEDDPDDRGETQIEYGLHKLLCEDRLFAAHTDWGFPATTVPFSMVLGPHNAMTDREQRMFARLRAGRPILVPGDGSTRLQVGDVDDQARALEQLMGVPTTFGRRYNLTGAESVTRNDYVAACAAAVGVEPDVRHIPAELMESLWTGARSIDIVQQSGALDIRSSGTAKKQQAQGPRAMLRTRFMLCINLVQHLAPNLHWWDQDTSFSIDRLRNDVGWRPEHTTASMLARAHAWWAASERAAAEYDWTTEDQILSLLD
ncbi:MAG: NAD-dependent epimerase/dehydratase family protein [Actinomycetota bacterium]